MAEELIQKIIDKGQKPTIAFFEADRNCPSGLFETICAMLNTSGGIIFLGINNEGSVTGISQPELVLKDIIAKQSNAVYLKPNFGFTPRIRTRGDVHIISIRLPPSSQVHKHADKIYEREGSLNIEVTGDGRLSELYSRKKQTFSEGEIFPGLSLSDLDEDVINKARNIIHSANASHPWLSLDNMSMLKESGLYKTDFSNGEEGFTLGAALLFGKDQTINNLLPAYKIEAMERIINLDRYDDRITLKGNLIDAYLQLMAFVEQKLPEKFFIEAGQRKDLRALIFREVIGNVIVHREYTNAMSTDFIIYKDKVVATNPNKPNVKGNLLPDDFNPLPKNPNIRGFFKAMGWSDEIGSGVRNVNKYLKLYIDTDELPKFNEDNVFTTTIPLGNLLIKGGTNGGTNGGTDKKRIKAIIQEKFSEKTSKMQGNLTKLLTQIATEEGNLIPFYAKKTRTNENTLEKHITLLKDAELIEKRGETTTTGGYYLTETLREEL